MEPAAALRRIAFILERQNAATPRVKAFRRAAAVVDDLGPAALAELHKAGKLTTLEGIGDSTARVIGDAIEGRRPEYLARLEAEEAPRGLDAGAAALLAALRGDLHVHSDWSDGGSPIEEMARTARDLGHEYIALTDHSPRLTVANGLSQERLHRQLEVVEALNRDLAPFRILTGIEVDINEDGSLDQHPDILAQLDVVVASVHSKLRAESDAMTRRMVLAIANPRMDILGHCTGRMRHGARKDRPESEFDAEIVFAACARFDKAVEINCRPERNDPPRRLITLAQEFGCKFAIDSDSHAPGQMAWLEYGCARGSSVGVTAEMVVNTLAAGALLAWTASHEATT
jgi:putative hydrolase